MDKNQLKETLQDTAPDVLTNIKASHRFKIPQKEPKISILTFLKTRSIVMVTPLIVLTLLLVFILNPTPSEPVIATTVTLDINPSVEITLDKDDYVIHVNAVNNDGEDIIDKSITYKGITLEQAMNYLLNKAVEKGYIRSVDDIGNAVENVILISVDTSDETIRLRVQTAVENNIASKMQNLQMAYRLLKNNSSELTEDQQNRLEEIATQYKITKAKLVLIQDIITLDDTYSIADLKDYSIRELYVLRESLSEDDSNCQGNCSN